MLKRVEIPYASAGQWELQSLFKAAENADNIVAVLEAHTGSKLYYLFNVAEVNTLFI